MFLPVNVLGAIPAHPTTPMPHDAEIAFTIFLGIPVAIGLFFAIRQIVKGQGPILLLCLIGGAFSCLWEPIVDVLGLCYIREGASLTTFSSMGRDFPLFINFVYIWYVGGLGYVAYRIFSNGVTKKALFTLYFTDLVINIFLESPGVIMGAYEYYGPQPLNFWGLPLWWVFVNPLMPLIMGAILYRMRPHLHGWRIVGIIPLLPMADGLGNAATAWPMWTGLNGDWPTWATHITAGITFCLAVYAVWILSFVVARPESEIGKKTKYQILREALVNPPGSLDEQRAADAARRAPDAAPAPVPAGAAV
ncbi:MAG: hypothetical protein M0P31_03410 [Solirubrobacteraceae bacterium]|nr:hypothetical protein [Solirubrobacteraceae bacterium]